MTAESENMAKTEDKAHCVWYEHIDGGFCHAPLEILYGVGGRCVKCVSRLSVSYGP